MGIEIVESFPTMSDDDRMLVHEHMFCRFRAENNQLVENYLQSQLLVLQENGVRYIIDPTPYTSPEMVRKMQLVSEIKVGFSVGYYTERYVSAGVRAMTLSDLVSTLQKKVRYGVGPGRLKPMMLKCGSGGSNPSKTEEKLVRAVSEVQKLTGLPMQVHSCDGAEEQYEIMKPAKVVNDKIMFCHLEMGMKTGRRLSFGRTIDRCKRVLDRGSFIFFNDFGLTKSKYRDAVFSLIYRLCSDGYGSKICAGTDSNYSVRRGKFLVRGVDAESRGARKYDYIFNHTIRFLIEAGLDKSSVENICFHNCKAFAGVKNIAGSSLGPIKSVAPSGPPRTVSR